MAPGPSPIASPCASPGGDRDAVLAIEPGASEAQVKTAMHGPVSRLCVGQQPRCAQLRLQRGKSSLCQSQGEKGDFLFFFFDILWSFDLHIWKCLPIALIYCKGGEVTQGLVEAGFEFL